VFADREKCQDILMEHPHATLRQLALHLTPRRTLNAFARILLWTIARPCRLYHKGNGWLTRSIIPAGCPLVGLDTGRL